MNYNVLTIIIINVVFMVSCSVFEKIVYRPDINQGNYLTDNDIAKIHVGMTKIQVAYVLGTAMIKDPFGSNTWYYIFRRESNHEIMFQKTLTLTFNNNDILINIDKKQILSKKY